MGRGEEEEEEGGEGSCDNHLIMSEDVLIQIFLYLPVISLLRFKSVCKSWRSIIESTFFIHLHATTTTSSLLFFRYDEKEEMKKGNIFRLFVDDDKDDKFEVFEDLGRPSSPVDFKAILMVGCCNGIICLEDSYSMSVALWNPAIKQSRILPKPSSSNHLLATNHYNNLDSNWVKYFVGFGIDLKTTTKKNNDYKVLLITSLAPTHATTYDGRYNSILLGDKTKYPFARTVQVYSLSTDSWKCIDDANYLSVAHPDLDITTSNSPLHLNDRCFFMAHYYIKVEEDEEDDDEELHSMPLIMSFDFTQEIFRTIELPYDRRTKFDPHSHASLFLFGQKIALKDVLSSYNEFDIWVLNEQQQQGVMEEEESWTKFYTFGPYESFYTPRCIVDNGEFAIMHGYEQDPNCQDYDQKTQKMQLLNLSNGETNDLQRDCQGLCQVDVYKASLVPINSATVDKPICGV